MAVEFAFDPSGPQPHLFKKYNVTYSNLSGYKENNFYCLPFGQAEASIY